MNILIFGSGVIGSIYAVKLANSDVQVTMYARGERLKTLREQGLLYKEKTAVQKAEVQIIDKIPTDKTYDFVFVTVQYDQIKLALQEVKSVHCNNIVTMVNNPKGYDKWEEIIGMNRIIPAFPGAGGSIKNGILDFKITPKIMQPTTFGELNGLKTDRIKKLATLLKQSHIPSVISSQMDDWQKCHLALVLPLAKGIYKDGGDNFTTAKNKAALMYMVDALKSNFTRLKEIGVTRTPKKLVLLSLIPRRILTFLLKRIYNTKLAGTVICEHALNAREEMEKLDEDFEKMLVQSSIR